ncbi:MAG: GTP-binding protein [Candidatus Odinarchaeota archaeon]
MSENLNNIIVTVTLTIDGKVNFNQIANKYSELLYNPKKFPGLIMQIERPKATVVIFSTGKMVITGLQQSGEVKNVMEKVINIFKAEGVELKNPEISIERAKPKRLKICLLGDKGVGKSTLMETILKASEKVTTKKQKDKIGVDFFNVKVRDIDSEDVILQLWNIIDEERFKQIQQNYYVGADGGIIFYDITDKSSFENIDHYILAFRKSKRNRHVPIILVGNKLDLRENRKVSQTEASKVAVTRKMVGYLEFSALDSQNVIKLFESICRIIIRKKNLNSISEALENDLNLRILMNLQMFKELSLIDISKRLVKSKATISRHTRKLIKLGLIESHVNEVEPQKGTIKRKYYKLSKDLNYHIEKRDFNFWQLKSNIKWKIFSEFYLKKLYNFKAINFLSKRLNNMLEDFNKHIFGGFPPLIKQYGRYIENIPLNLQFLNNKQNQKVHTLLLEFNTKLEDILADDDGSEKSCLFVNMMLPMVDLINLLEKPELFNHVILNREIKKEKEVFK